MFGCRHSLRFARIFYDIGKELPKGSSTPQHFLDSPQKHCALLAFTRMYQSNYLRTVYSIPKRPFDTV